MLFQRDCVHSHGVLHFLEELRRLDFASTVELASSELMHRIQVIERVASDFEWVVGRSRGMDCSMEVAVK